MAYSFLVASQHLGLTMAAIIGHQVKAAVTGLHVSKQQNKVSTPGASAAQEEP